MPGGSAVDLEVTGVGGVPENGVGAVVLNVTAVDATAATFVTVWPTGESQPVASNLNLVPGQAVPNLVIATVGEGGQVSLGNKNGNVHVAVDVMGWFPTTSDYGALSPARLLDTRDSTPVPGDSAVDLDVTGVGGVPADGVGAVVLNVTAVDATDPTFVTVWPTGEPQPVASNLNLVPGVAVPNLVIATVGEGGQVSLGNKNGEVDLAVDVMGWFPTGSDYGALTPARLLDTRESSPVPGNSAVDLDVTGVGGIPADGVGAVVLNVTAVDATDPTFVTVWPTGEPQPVASNLNLVPGEAVPNLVIATVGDNGQVSLGNKNGNVHLAVDVMGWFPTETGPPPPPANDQIVFSSDRHGGDDDIFVMNPDGSGVKNLTANRDGEDFQPKWSPDKTKIAFASNANTDADTKIVVMDADGGNQTVLETNLADADYPSWSPDGTKIVFSGISAGDDADVSIYVMDSTGSDVELIVEPGAESGFWLIEPTFSPDGSSIGYTAWDWTSFPDMYIYPEAEAWIHPYPATSTDQSAGAQLEPTTAVEPYGDYSMEWFQGFSPDGEEVLFRWENRNYNHVEYRSDLFTVPSDDLDADPQPITDRTRDDYEYNASYGSDGETIVYAHYPNPVGDDDSGGDIWAMDTDGEHPRNLTPGTPSDDDWPDQ